MYQIEILQIFGPNLQKFIFLVKNAFQLNLGPFSVMAAKRMIYGLKRHFFGENLAVKGLKLLYKVSFIYVKTKQPLLREKNLYHYVRSLNFAPN